MCSWLIEKDKQTTSISNFINMSDTIHPQESVFNCIAKEEIPTAKPPRYVSKFRPAVVQEKKSNKHSRKTMGPAKVELTPPENYLKKHSKEPKLPGNTQCSKDCRKNCTCVEKKPDVPARTDKPLMGIRTNRNFIKTAECGVTKKPQPITVDSYKGHKQPLENSGLVPKYIYKKDFGEIPEYLLRRSEEERRAQKECEDFVREQREHAAMKHLPDEERQAVLERLKNTWDKALREYQGLSLVIDTLSKKAYKQHLEELMRELEEQIDVLQRFKTCFITEH